jgi:hypothetical protein
MRTGGVVSVHFPPSTHVSSAAAPMGFKATAGLHHRCAASMACPTKQNAPRGVMHGPLNVFHRRIPLHGLTRDIDLLNATSLDGIELNDETIKWREYVVTRDEISIVRRRFAIGFGSCSFTEPVEDLVNLELLT